MNKEEIEKKMGELLDVRKEALEEYRKMEKKLKKIEKKV